MRRQLFVGADCPEDPFGTVAYYDVPRRWKYLQGEDEEGTETATNPRALIALCTVPYLTAP